MKNFIKFIIASIVALPFVACDDDDDDSATSSEIIIETTQDDALTATLSGYIGAKYGYTVCYPTDDYDLPLYISVSDGTITCSAYKFIAADETRLDEMTSLPTDTEWLSAAEIIEGATYWVRYAEVTIYRYLKLRIVAIDGNDVYIEYVEFSTEVRDTTNSNANDTSVEYASNLEMPYFEETDMMLFLPHTVDETLNYSIFYNCEMLHAQWVAFSFTSTTAADNVTRTDAWDVDPLIPSAYQTNNSYHTSDGFDRGHLCASEDRVWSTEANEQTFYYSNMSPQLNDLNSYYWAQLEALVRTWGRSVGSTFDNVYVAKGGTLNTLLTNFTGEIAGSDSKYPTTDENGYTTKGLPCPKYYFMAILAETDGDYQAIAFLVEHKEGWAHTPTTAQLQSTVVSIDELEEATGIDFFCNLIDEYEDDVEASYDLTAWDW